MKALVTGATGFVGSAVLRHVVAAGHAARVLVRPTSDRRNIEGVACEVAVGDLTDPASLERAVAGCDAVFHVAADYRLWVRDAEAMLAANVAGTRRLVEAAMAAGAGRIVYTSSVAAIGYRDDGHPADETTPATEADMVGTYKRSKFLAEQAVLRLVREDGAPVVTVNPSSPFGPRDAKPTPTGRIVVAFAKGHIPAYVETGLNVVHVDDVAAGHLLALERGRVGERYILGGDNMQLSEILACLARHLGRPAPRLRLPRLPLYPLAVASELYGRVCGREPMLTVDALRMAGHPMLYSSDKAKAELGYAPRPGARALADAADWYKANGYF